MTRSASRLFGILLIVLSSTVLGGAALDPTVSFSERLTPRPAFAQVFEGEPVRRPPGQYKSLRRGVRKTWKTLQLSSRRWRQWLPGILLVAGALILVPAVDRALFRTWRERGFSGARSALALGVAVYLRLLFDRRAPGIGKLLLLFAVVYGVARRDLTPDAIWPTGVLDDLIVVTLASKAFLATCPDSLIEEHARKAARRRTWSLRRRAIAEP